MDKEERGFFVLHTKAIETLYDELESLIGKDISKSVIFRFGFKCGFTTSQKMGLRDLGPNALDYLEEIWMQTGFARPASLEENGQEYILTFRETLESSYDGDSCDFTRGFLGGVFSGITGEPYYCREKRCVSAGHDICEFLVSQKEVKKR